MDLLDFTHHGFIYMQTTRGIHQQHILKLFFRRIQRSTGNFHRLLVRLTGIEAGTHLTRQGLQLLDCRRAIDVTAHHHHFLVMPFLQQLCQLGHGGGLARTLQTRHQHHRRWLRRQVQPFICLAHGGDQFLIDNLDQCLPR